MRNIEELRKDINEVNKEILDLFIKRMEISKDIAIYKMENNIPILDRKREEEVLQNVVDNTPDDLKHYSLDLFKKIMELSKEYQNEIK